MKYIAVLVALAGTIALMFWSWRNETYQPIEPGPKIPLSIGIGRVRPGMVADCAPTREALKRVNDAGGNGPARYKALAEVIHVYSQGDEMKVIEKDGTMARVYAPSGSSEPLCYVWISRIEYQELKRR